MPVLRKDYEKIKNMKIDRSNWMDVIGKMKSLERKAKKN
jgi:hypothetical protein